MLRGSEAAALPLTEAADGGLVLGDAHAKRDQRKALWAREVFHSVLAIDLQSRGAATAEQLYYRLSWFMLPFDRGEISQILDSARRNGIVERLGDELDAFGRPVLEEWSLTEEGKKLKRPRSLSLPDLWGSALGSRAGFSTVFSSTKSLLLGLVPYLTVFLGAKLDLATEGMWASAIAGAVVLATVLMNGIKGDLKLREAARSWPRMREKRSARYTYQLSTARLAFIPTVMTVVYLTGAVGILLSVAWWQVALAVTGELFAAALFYLSWLWDSRLAWSGKDKDLLAWEQKWRLREPPEQWAGPPVPESDGHAEGAVVNPVANAG